MLSVSYRPTLRETLRLRGDTNFDLALTERLLDVIELRLRPVEDKKASLEAVEQLIRDVGLQRINDVLTPAIQSVLLIQERGFLMARSSTSATIAANDVHTFVIDDEHERATFVPGPYPALTRQGSPDDTAVTRLIGWQPATGELMVEIIAVFGDPGPHDDWVIVATAGVANAMQAMLDEVRGLAEQVAEDRLAVADDREAAQTARGEAIAARNAAEGFAGDAHNSALAAQTFDPASYYAKAETYSKGEVDGALGEKLEADDLTAAATSFDNSGTELVAETVQAALAELDDEKASIAALGLHFRNMQAFTSSGTFTPPAGVDRVFVIVQGGGQGGRQDTAANLRCGNGGDCVMGFIDVTGAVSVTIGAGSAGTSGSDPSAGGDTSVDSLAVAKGGSSSTASSLSGGLVLPGQSPSSGIASLGGSSGFGGFRGSGGSASVTTSTAGQAGFVIVMW